MASDQFYSEAAPSQAESTDVPGTEPDAKDDAAENAEEGSTALVPRSFCGPDCKVGDTYTVKIVSLYEDEAELELVNEKNKDQSEMDKAAGGLDKYARMKE